MEFIYRLIEAFVGFVRRNYALCLFILFLALFSPLLLVGALKIVLYVVLFFVLLSIIAALALGYRLNRLARKQMQNGDAFYGRTYSREREQAREGEVSVHRTQPQEKKVNSRVGDYVDFEEVDDRK